MLDLPQTLIVYDSSVMPRKLTHEEAAQVMREHGFTPIKPYANSSTPWLSIRDSCGHQVSPTLSNVKLGKGGWLIFSKKYVAPEVATNDMRAAGAEPLEKYPGDRRCTDNSNHSKGRSFPTA